MKKKTWKKMLPEDKESIDYLLQQKELYEGSEGFNDEDWNYLQIRSSLYKMLKDQEKEKERIDKQVAKIEKWKEENSEAAEDYLVNGLKNVYFVGTQNTFYQFLPESGTWLTFSPDGIANTYGWDSAGDRISARNYLRDNDRIKLDVKWTFRPYDENIILNQMRTDHWVQPKKGKVDEWFDVLMESVSGNNQEARDHLEQVIMWKYLHPEEHRLPSIMIYGQGRAGRNTFVINLMRTIFGEHYVDPVNFEMVFGQFSGMIKGKVILLIDEVMTKQNDASNRVKSIIGNEKIPINNKGGKQETIENTVLVFMVGNSDSGSVLLDNSPSDARYSLIRIEKTIYENMMERFDCTMEEARTMWLENMKIFDDREEVAKWLDSIITKWNHLKEFPSGYHGEEYKKLVVKQESPSDDFCRNLFRSTFEAIPKTYVQELAKIYMEKFYDRSKSWISNKNSIYTKVDEWLGKNRPEIEKKKVTLNNDPNGKGRVMCYTLPNISNTDVSKYFEKCKSWEGDSGLKLSVSAFDEEEYFDDEEENQDENGNEHLFLLERGFTK